MIKQHHQFIQEVEDLHPNKWRILGEYKGAKKRVEAECLKCGTLVNNYAASYIQKHSGCRECARRKPKSNRYTTEFVKRKIEDCSVGEYELIGEYVKSDVQIEIRHIKCGYKWRLYYGNFVNKGSRCPKCVGMYNMTAKEFNKYVEDMTDGEYTCLTPFYNNTQHVMMKHNHCGHAYAVTPKNFKKGRRCPQCRESFGETKIRRTLENLGVEYEQEKRLQTGMLRPNHFRLDFYLPEYKNVIEYDGRQHFYPTETFGGVSAWKRTQMYDSMKYEMVLNLGWSIKLISFREFDNLEEVVEKHIETLRNPNPVIPMRGRQ